MNSRCALVVGHPGHELRVHGWAVEARPRIYALTDGSGSGGTSRIPSSQNLAVNLQASCGEIFPAGTDRDLYLNLLNGDADFFIRIAERLSQSFVLHNIRFVAGDAAEGFIPTHDICRAIINAAVSATQRTTGRTIANYEFSLAEWAEEHPVIHNEHCLHRTLSDAGFRAKIQAAWAYPRLEGEVRNALDIFGAEHFRHECLRPAKQAFPPPEIAAKPYYEVIGEQRVATGIYASTIRYAEHVYPVIEALRHWAQI
jgi:hypothetical protein